MHVSSNKYIFSYNEYNDEGKWYILEKNTKNIDFNVLYLI
jgi:hypothetical protein